jgi:hypothetical protein
MPHRILRESILTSDPVDKLSMPAEVFYRRLMSVVDDFGRFDARPSILRAACFPLRIDKVREADISRWLTECETAGLIALYAVDEKPYVLYHKVATPRAKHSRYPEPTVGTCAHVNTGENTCAHVRPYSYSNSNANASTPRKRGDPDRPREFADKAVIPPELDTPEFKKSWTDYLAYRVDKSLPPLLRQSAERQFRKFVEWGGWRVAVDQIEDTIRQGYQGIFPPKPVTGGGNGHGNVRPAPRTMPVGGTIDF